MRGISLSRRADVVLAALDGKQANGLDCTRIDDVATPLEAAGGQIALPEDAIDGRQEELGRHVQRRQILVVEVSDLVRLSLLALSKHPQKVSLLRHVAFRVHGKESGELQASRNNAAAVAGATQQGPRVNQQKN